MRVRVIAVGTRMPAWVRAACDDYLTRLRPRFPVALTEVEPGTRRGGSVQRALLAEGRRLLAMLTPTEHVVALDEGGSEFSTRELAGWLGTRIARAQNLAFLIGGPDGLAREVLARSDFTLSLSRLTLPHALARVVLSEQLYRAHTILTHHPYHRD